MNTGSNQTTVGIGAAAGGAVAVIIWMLSVFKPEWAMSPEAAAGLTVLITAAFQRFIPAKSA